MASCARCGKHWSADHRQCPDDGTPLVQDAPARKTDGSLAIAAHDEDELASGTIAGEYRIECKLGEGAMGAVYGARHTLIGKRAAIKVIRSELSASRNAVDRFVLEAQAVNQIGHPNIVDVFGFGALDDGRCFFVMEWLEGDTLRERLRRPVGYLEALELVETIAKALQAAHEAGVVHRDLKPDNVYLANVKDDRPVVKLLDFGLAKLSGTVEPRFERTRTGVVLGTPLYISPEQAKGTRIDSATDVYSLGAISYEMFTGQVPFMAESAVEIMSLHITALPRPARQLAPGISPELETLIMAMLDKNPARRPTAAQARAELAAMRKRASAPVIANSSVASFINSTMPGANVPIAGAPVASIRSVATPAGPRARRWIGIAIGMIAVGAASTVIAYVVANRPAARETTPATAAVAPQVEVDAAAIAVVAIDAERVVTETPPTTALLALPTTPPPTPTPALPTTPPPTPAVPTPALATPAPATPTAVTRTPTLPTPHAGALAAVKPAAPHPGQVVVQVIGTDRAKIIVDGRVAASRSSGVTLDLAPGDHEIDVRSPGHLPASRRIHVVAGSNQQLELTPALDPNAVHNPYGDD